MYKTCLFLFLLSCGTCLAQKNKFSNTLSFGFVGTQVKGDALDGFDKIGVQAGLGTSYQLKTKNALGFSLNFIQKGSRKAEDPKNNDYTYYKMKLSYLEMPVRYTWQFSRIDLLAGVNIAYLISASEENPAEKTQTTNTFKPYDCSLGGEFHYKLVEKWALALSFSQSILPIRLAENGLQYTFYRQGSQYNTTLGLSILYKLN